jgi:hypothetical protein
VSGVFDATNSREQSHLARLRPGMEWPLQKRRLARTSESGNKQDFNKKAFATEIYAAVHSGKLKQPFSAETAKRACPGWADRTYKNFFSKHCVGNPSRTTELFVASRRVSSS